MRALGIPFSLVTTALGGAFRGMLDTRTPLTVAAAANALNLALDPVLIFGLGPVPAFAAPGAAAATVVAEAVAAAALLRRLSTTRLWPRWLGLPKWGQVHEFAEASGAVLTRTAALQSTLLLATATVARHAAVGGAAEVAAHQVRHHTLQRYVTNCQQQVRRAVQRAAGCSAPRDTVRAGDATNVVLPFIPHGCASRCCLGPCSRQPRPAGQRAGATCSRTLCHDRRRRSSGAVCAAYLATRHCGCSLHRRQARSHP